MLRDQLSAALKDGMRAKDDRAVSTVRLILAAVKDRDIAARGCGESAGISDQDLLVLLQSMVKQRRESIGLYEQGGRMDLVQQEQEEIEVIERFLPRQLDATEIEAAVSAAIDRTGAATLKDMGKVMADLRAEHTGQMDFASASATAKEKLGG